MYKYIICVLTAVSEMTHSLPVSAKSQDTVVFELALRGEYGSNCVWIMSLEQVNDI